MAVQTLLISKRSVCRLAGILALAAAAQVASSTNAAAEPASAPEPRAAAPGVQAMSLDEALSFARASNPQVIAENARLALAKERALEPAAGRSVRFGATLQALGGSNNNSAANWLSTRGVAEFPRIAGTGFLQQPSDTNWKPYMSTAAGITGEKLLFDFGRIAAETAAADALTDVESARREDIRLAIDLGVRESYDAVMSARGVLEVAREAASRSRIHRDAARARVAQGLRSPIEQQRAEADLARFEVATVRAEGGLRSAQSTFAVAVGVKAPLLDVSGTGAPPLSTLIPSIELALNDAAQKDPAIRAAFLQARAAHENVRAAEAQTRPTVRVIGTVSSAAGGAPREGFNDQTWGYGAVPWIPDYYAGIVLAWRFYEPILDARTKTARQQEAVARAETATVQQERLSLVEQAWISLDVAIRALPSLDRSLTAARANYTQADVRYQEGLGTSVELADAESLRVGAELDLVQGQFEIERARARLQRVTGGGQ